MAHSIYYDWKVDFSDNPSRTQGGIYSLYDLLILETEGSYQVRSLSNAVYLNHDVICYNSAVYDKKTGQPNRANGTFDIWAKHGIDIAPVKIDSRALLHQKTNKNSKFIRYFSKDSVLKYSTVQEAIKNAIVAEASLKDLFINYDSDWKIETSYAYKGHSVTSEDVLANNTDIIVLEPDESFNLIYNTENTESLTAYKKVFIKQDVLKNILNYYINNYSGFGFFIEGNANSLKADQILQLISSTTKFEPGTALDLSDDAPLIFEFLKNTFVFIRASFFADYIQPEVFKQNLTEQSEVKHKNIIISGQGDFHRYSDSSSEGPENTRFYRMQTAPTVDLLSKNYAKQVKINNYDNAEDRDALYNELFAKHELFGSVLYDNKNTKASSTSPNDYLTSPQYFDPEVPQYRDNNSEASDPPVLIPEAGNLYVDGRILGPTIDEIWKYFKQIVSGTIASDKAKNGTDNGFTYNDEYPCNENTTPEERKGATFYKEYNSTGDTNSAPIIGDPIESEIKTHENGFEYLNITKWVTPPTHFKIQVYEFLKAASNEVTSGLETDDSKTEHKIENLAPDNNLFSYDGHTPNPPTAKDNIYGPRGNPYSLRELEAMLANTKYNINALMSFLVKNYTVNGALSHGTGGLFQFHKNYNSKIGDPNTIYTGPELGADKGADIEDRANLTSKTLSDYGKETADKSNSCTAKDVYLAADGTWRYIHQETRLRIFNPEF